ncbi:neurofilament medium polypeptide isoform X2 [Drosophila ananassae]|uniref:neurofilament medium polypeptide isoform X2 n=1 Tax=Drosophila ananassae TaxID=7217 RepID=UPI001CFF9448|nr:neurofilament medium polypeptide isoform X2 [Drosophila ananassae]
MSNTRRNTFLWRRSLQIATLEGRNHGEPRRSSSRKRRIMGMKTRSLFSSPADGQMSVLELLELQARARAIRSQLAMEPITKIEVKSDDDDESPEKPVQRREKEKRSKKNTETGKRKSQEQPQAKESKKDEEVVEEAPRKKIKIKRNYRQATVSPEKEAAKSSPPTVSAPPEESTKKKSRSKSRSASLDVIPIQTETETLLISDSTDDEGTKKDQPKEAEAPVSVQPQVPEVESEPEEGEVRDEPEEIAKPEETPKPDERTQSKEPEKSEDSQKTEKSEESTKAEVKPAEEKEAPPDNSEQTALDDEDQNDDVISIGGDLEMIEEMTKDEEPPTLSNIKSEKSEKQEPEEQDNDVISLDTSEDEREKLQPNDSESWRTRYLKSSKVSQVLAASRLGKRVRDKIKKSKRSKATDCDDQEKSSKQQEVFTSKHEDGSIEQYQELLQHRQRKSSNSKADK